jgi:hypothetical protein
MSCIFFSSSKGMISSYLLRFGSQIRSVSTKTLLRAKRITTVETSTETDKSNILSTKKPQKKSKSSKSYYFKALPIDWSAYSNNVNNSTSLPVSMVPSPIVAIAVYGEPIPLARHRAARFGGMYNPSSTAQKEFRELCLPYLPTTPYAHEPIAAHLNFYFSRPKLHYGTGKNAQILKTGMPNWHASKCGK